MKTLADQMREALDAINSGVVPEATPHVYASGYQSKSAASSIREIMDEIAAPQSPKIPYHNTTEIITNWAPPPEEGEPGFDDWNDEVEVGIAYTISGSDSPAIIRADPGNSSPAEYADIEIDGIYDLTTGEDVYDKLPKETIDAIEDSIWRNESASRNEYDGPEPDESY